MQGSVEARIADDTQKLAETYEAGKRRTPRVPEETLEKFRREVEDYVHKLTLALPMQRSHDFGPFIELHFVLVNEGSAPATDVILDLKFPDGSFVIGVSDLNNKNRYLDDVEMPYRPVAEWTIAPKPRHPWSVALELPFIPPPLPYRPPPTGPRGPLYHEDRSMVQYSDTKVNQGRTWAMRPVIVYLPPSINSGFPINWSLRFDELPKVLTGTLNVKPEGNKTRKARN